MNRREIHPSEDQLALLAGGDLSLLERWRVSRHVTGCESCAALVEEYRRLRLETGREELGLDEAAWSRLEAEMRANIRLGLAAGAVVQSDAQPVWAGAWTAWRLAAVSASLVFVFGASVWLGRAPAAPTRGVEIVALQPEVEAGAEGVALRRPGSGLELKSLEGSAVVRTVSWDGTARARYFDGETGQVTIHQVAWEGSDAQ
jgi:hypothetical protein